MRNYSSRLPVWVVLLFIGNLLLVIILEMLLLYPTPLPLTEAALAEADARFSGAALTQSQHRGYLHCALAETSDGDVYLIPVRAHGLVFNRGRILDKQIVPVAADADTTINVKVGIYTSTLTASPIPPPWLEDAPPEELYLTIDHSSSASGSSMAVLYIAIGAVLTFLELALLQLIKGD